jgi:membrane protein
MREYISRLADRAKQMELMNTTAIISYYFLLSFFPLLVCIGMALALSGIRMDMVSPYLESVIPAPILEVVYPIFDSILDAQSGGGILSLGIIGTLWSAGRGLQYIRYGIDRAYGQERHKNFFLTQMAAVAILVGIMVLMILLVLVYSFGESVFEYVCGGAANVLPLFNWVKWPVTVLLLSAALIVVYKSIPEGKLKIREVLPGVLLSTVGLIVLVQGFSVYIGLAAKSLSVYGAMGSVFILILWVRFIAILLLLGAAVNADAREAAIKKKSYGRRTEKKLP